jgi:hypothetical protein
VVEWMRADGPTSGSTVDAPAAGTAGEGDRRPDARRPGVVRGCVAAMSVPPTDPLPASRLPVTCPRCADQEQTHDASRRISWPPDVFAGIVSVLADALVADYLASLPSTGASPGGNARSDENANQN